MNKKGERFNKVVESDKSSLALSIVMFFISIILTKIGFFTQTNTRSLFFVGGMALIMGFWNFNTYLESRKVYWRKVNG
tara:strand:+ start:187 stop:420 length:234 start_codon:yes stop_codon:yes gene_type:complete